jgi:hypothetical protein
MSAKPQANYNMKKGRLNKAELARIARCYRDIDSILRMIPKDANDRDEQDTRDCLIVARNRLGELLRWQDFDGAWMDAQLENDAIGEARADSATSPHNQTL